MKILSPAGNFESLKIAVFNGADEVYLGINTLNARNNINGFHIENLKSAVDFAHIFGVKVNLAINILFSNSEIQHALDTIVDAYNLGVDCFIIQDLGLAYLVNKYYPQIEIHASTQMALHNLEGVKTVEQFGFKRVVLARETPLSEIKRIKQNIKVELEYFAQGALCVSFSGNCYLSSYLHNASGNRGKCKQLCRLPYTFMKDSQPIKSGYLLSAKDFNMINRLQDLKQAGIDVIKIEGRARRPFYVAVSTNAYFNALNNKPYNAENLQLAFNRNYTAGYFNGNSNIISDFNNHIGICVGKVEKINYGKKFNEIFITSNRELSAKSTFKIFKNKIEKNTITAYDLKKIQDGKYMLTSAQKVNVYDDVHLIIDAQLENQVLSQVKKKNVSVQIFAKENMPITALINLENNFCEVVGCVCEKAKSQPLTVADLQNNFAKSDIFNAELEICELDKIFITKQNLNTFRRDVFDKIYEMLTKPYYHSLQKVTIEINYEVIKFNDFQIIEDINQNFEAKNIIYSPEIYSIEDIRIFQNKCNTLNKHAFLDTPNFATKKDIELLSDIINKTQISIVANNYYALNFKTDIVIGAGLNVYNNVTAQAFNKPIIVAESDIATQINYAVMTLRHCPFKEHINDKCSKCPYSTEYAYKMQNGRSLKLKRKKLSTCTFYLSL